MRRSSPAVNDLQRWANVDIARVAADMKVPLSPTQRGTAGGYLADACKKRYLVHDLPRKQRDFEGKGKNYMSQTNRYTTRDQDLMEWAIIKTCKQTLPPIPLLHLLTYSFSDPPAVCDCGDPFVTNKVSDDETFCDLCNKDLALGTDVYTCVNKVPHQGRVCVYAIFEPCHAVYVSHVFCCMG